MTGAELHYCVVENPIDQRPGDCHFRRAQDEHGSYVLLSMCVESSQGEACVIQIPVSESGPVNVPRLTWGVAQVAPGRWQIAPSVKHWRRINDEDVELWHQVPVIVDGPAALPSQQGGE